MVQASNQCLYKSFYQSTQKTSDFLPKNVQLDFPCERNFELMNINTGARWSC